MAAPPNLTALTAIDLGAPPATFTQRVDDAGTTYTVWFRWTAPLTDLVEGFFANGDLLVPYRPTANFYTGPASAPVLVQSGSPNVPAVSPVTGLVEYFLEISPNAGNPSPAILVVTVTSAPTNRVPTGSILINDDTAGHPGAILAFDTGATINFLSPQVAGEQGDVLTNGVSCFNNASTGDIVFYDNQLNVIRTIALGGSPLIRTCNGADRFYVSLGVPPVVQTYDDTGTLDQTFTLTGVPALRAIAAANDELILYYAETASGSAIKRWDLPGAGALSDLAAGITGYFVVDILVLADDTIIASFHHNVTEDFLIRRYDTSGTLLNTYSLGVSFLPAGTFSRLAYSPDDPDAFWAWTHDLIPPSLSSSRFREIQTVDGEILTETTAVEFEVGVYQGTATEDPLATFGPSFSCPFIILRADICVPNTDGTVLVTPIIAGEATGDVTAPAADAPSAPPAAASVLARTLIFELPKRRWFYDRYDKEAIRTRLSDPGDDVYAQILGGTSGHLYQYSAAALRDDDTNLAYRIWTHWPDADDPRGEKIVSDLALDVDPGNSVTGIVAAPVVNNAQRILSDVTVGAGLSGRQQLSLNPLSGQGLIARNAGLRLSGTLTGTDTERPVFYEWIFAWAPNWVNAGTSRAKFLQGFVIHADTRGAASSFRIDSGDGVVQQSFPVPVTTGERGIPYSFTTPFLAHLVRLVPLGSWRILGIDWVWEPTPEHVLHWQTQPTTHDLPGYLTVRDGMIAYAAPSTVTWTVSYTDGGSTAYTLPATGGAYTRLYVPCVARKGTAVTYDFVSGCPFQLFQRDCSVRIQGWGQPGGLQVMTPFGGLSRERGARI